MFIAELDLPNFAEFDLASPRTGIMAGSPCPEQVMRGYWNEPEKTAEAIDADGWVHTGDIGVMDGDGHLAITGRIKDMVIRGGENVYPRESEEFLVRHPDIVDAGSNWASVVRR